MKAKRILVALSLVAIILSSTAAFASVMYTSSGKWEYGTTGIFGGGTVYSKYIDYVHTYSKATVINAKGKIKSDTQSWKRAEAKLDAYAFQTDYAYYDFWD